MSSLRPGFTDEGAFSPDLLIAGDFPIQSKDILVKSGQDLVRGSILGVINGAATASTVTGTGNGTMALAGTPAGKNTQVGTYTLTCTAAATNSGTFRVVAPDGSVVGDATVGSAFTSTHINFTISDGSTDFIVGDYFTVAVVAGTKYKLCNKASTDGSQRPVLILAEDTDATDEDMVAVAYMTGDFNSNAITLGGSTTASDVRDDLVLRSIFLHDPVTA